MTVSDQNFNSPARAISSPKLLAVTCAGVGTENLYPMKTIPLSRGKVAMVDDEDYDRANKFKWRFMTMHGNSYAHCHSPMVNGKRVTLMMHRVIMNASKGQEIDHKDHNGLNNQKSNLRFCTRSQNNANRRLDPKSKTGLKGVRYMSKQTLNPWRSSIGVSYNLIDLGSYSTAESAARAYNNAALKYFGEYASLNTL